VRFELISESNDDDLLTLENAENVIELLEVVSAIEPPPTCEVCHSEFDFLSVGDNVVLACWEHPWHRVGQRELFREVNKTVQARGLGVFARPVIGLDPIDPIRNVPQALTELAKYGTVYRYGGGLATVEPGTGTIHMLKATGLRAQLVTNISFTERETPTRRVTGEVRMPGELANAAYNSPDEWWRLPELVGVVRVPTLLPEGGVLTRRGYCEGTGTYFAPDEGMSDVRTDMDVTEALDWFAELVWNFPFVGEADKANAFGVLLLPFVRDVITGPTPLHIFEAPESRTGKSLLLQSLLIPGLGAVRFTPWPAHNDEEVGKKITMAVKSGAQAMNFDNVRDTIRSAILEMALTAPEWDDRLLGGSDGIAGPIRMSFNATINQAHFGGDLAGRIVPIQIDAGVENPSTRTGFRHRLPDWAREHRGDLVSAALSLVLVWDRAGRPEPSDDVPAFGGYESYRGVIGGILDVAGVPGFLSNRAGFNASRDVDRGVIQRRLTSMHRAFGGACFSPSEAVESGALPDVTTAQAFAEMAKKYRGRVVCGLRLDYSRTGGTSKYQITEVSA
jgi:hypothetical protein